MNSITYARPEWVCTTANPMDLPLPPDGLWLSAHLDPKSEMFSQTWSIYNASFNDVERRTLFEQLLAMRRLRYRFSAIRRKGAVVGVLGFWELEDFCFLEHIAVAPEYRSGGYGRRAIQMLQRLVRKPILLDVEPLDTDENAVRRVSFYQRLGFHYCEHPVALPPYIGKAVVTSNLMSWPMALDAGACEQTLASIEQEIYGLRVVTPRQPKAV